MRALFYSGLQTITLAIYFAICTRQQYLPVHCPQALSGFLMMLTQNGKLLYISDNAAEYLGHSMEDLLIHGDSVYDIIDKQDHGAIQAELGRGVPPQQGGVHAAHHGISPASLEGERRMFLCRMNVSRNARRQMRFGDQKVRWNGRCEMFQNDYSNLNKYSYDMLTHTHAYTHTHTHACTYRSSWCKATICPTCRYAAATNRCSWPRALRSPCQRRVNALCRARRTSSPPSTRWI